MNNMWKKCKLSDIGNVVGGATPSTKEEEYYGGKIPWLTPKDLSSYNERYITSGERNITEKGLKSCSAKLLPSGSILFSSRAPIGYVAIAKNPIATNQGFKSIIPNENIDSLFLYYLLKHNKEKIESMGSGTTFKEVSGATMKSVEVMIPSSLDIQKQIANILGSLDDKIELNNRINANLEEQAQALFRRWFVENKNKKWTYVDLGSVVKTTSGGTPSRSNLSYYENGTVKWLKSKELKGTYITQTEEKITQYAVENSSAKLLPQNSVLIAMYGATVGEYAIIAEKMTCNQAICALLPNENYPCFYLFMLAKNKKEELVNLAVGSAQQNISQVSIKQVQVPTCKELIRKYDKLVAPYFEKILNNIKQSQSLCQLRDILLPKLMNGEI